MIKLENKVSLITILTVLSYLSFYSFKVGEAIFFGYPVSYIWADISTLILVFFQNSIIIIFYVMLVMIKIKDSNGVFYDMIVVTPSVVILAVFKLQEDIWYVIIICLIGFLLIFLLSDCIRKIISSQNNLSDNKKDIVITILLLCFLSGFTGNFFASSRTLLIDDNGRVIVSNYKDYIIMKRCNKDGTDELFISAMPTTALKVLPTKYFSRDYLKWKCKVINNNHVNDPLIV